MTSYAGLDVSQQETHVCIVDAAGAMLWRGKARSEPAALAEVLRARAPELERAVLESGALSGWLCGGLIDQGFPAVCIDARAAHGALKQRRDKTDRSDAEGLARLAQTGWYNVVRIKSRASLEQRALLTARERLVRIHRDLLNQVRGLLKALGLVLPRTTPRRLTARIEVWLEQAPEMRPAIGALLAARAAVAEQLEQLDRLILRRAGEDPVCRRLATIPGVGAVTAACFVSVIDDPERFGHSDKVAAYLGLTPRRWQSGEVDRRGGVSKAGNAMARHLLYEAANSLLARVKRPCALRDWGLRLQERLGGKKARTALARKLAILMHKLWRRQQDFDWRVPVAA
ncbi:MAG TPA: IS110 family transposase [Geminicoccaceae bacterium]|nr:IS110 family transposase [Geminicoccaceae bacterium]